MAASSPTADPVEVERDGITVEKRLVTDEFPVPTVKFVIASVRDDTVTVRIGDRIPDMYSMDAIGFHPEYESDNWTAYQDHRIEFERELGPDESVTTIYGIRVDGDEDLTEFMTPPEIHDIEAGESGIDDIVDREESEKVRDMIADDDEPEPEPEPTPTVSDDDPIADEPEPAEADVAQADTPPAAGSLVEQLADELRDGEVAEEDRTTIQEELGLDLSASAEAQLRHLQTRVEDLLAYSEPLATFLDEGGVEQMDDLEATVAELESTVKRRDERIQSVRDDLRELSASVDELDADDLHHRLDEIAEQAEAAQDRATEAADSAETVTDDLQDLESDVAALRETVDEIEAWKDQLGELFG